VGAAEVASVRRQQEPLPCQTEPDSASSQTDLPLAKAVPISDIGSTSAITYLRKSEKNPVHQLRGGRKYEKQSPVDAKVSEKRGDEVLQVPKSRLPCSPWRRPWWCRLFPCSPWRTPQRSMWICPEESCSPWKAHAGAGSWQEPWPGSWRPRRSKFSGRSCSP